MVNGISGLDIPSLFYRVLGNIEERGNVLYNQILALTDTPQTGGTGATGGTQAGGSVNGESATSSISQEQMLLIQFEIGQYNATVEMLSSVSKSLTDMMKTLAQRSS